MSGKRRLQILHLGKFYAPHKGGMETYLQSLCNETRELVDIEALVASENTRTREEYVDHVKVSRIGTLFHLAAAPICPGMVRRISASRADLVHIHIPNPSAILAYLASGHTGRLIIGYHSDIIRHKFLRKGFKPFLHRALTRATALIAASPNYVDSSEILSAYRDRCHIIPYGIQLRDFERRDEAAVAPIRQRYGPRLILSVGRLVYYKGYNHLIKAMENVDGRLVIVGDGPLRGALEKQVTSRGLSGRVTLLGEIQDLVPYYHAADVFVLPSVARSEAFGIVQLEAMACGKPVVNTALASGVPYVSVHGVTGLTVPPADAGELARAISLLLEDEGLRVQYGQAARRRVQHEFRVEEMAARTLDLYRQVMESPPTGVKQLVRNTKRGASGG